MGGGTSKTSKGEAVDLIKDSLPDKRWVEDKTFVAENSLVYASSPLYNELRGLLGEPLGQKYLGEFAKSENSQENFFAWIDMEEYKAIPTADYRRCIAKNVFQKYIKPGAVMQLGSLTEDRIEFYKNEIYGNKDQSDGNTHRGSNASVESVSQGRLDLKPDLFMGLQHMVFREMAENTFKRFKESELYKEYEEKKDKTYNTVDVSDFEYLSYIGQGAFGMVAHVRKKSTGKEYAMKVMSKSKLVKTMGRRGSFDRRKEKINIERDALANSAFPFIVEMHYAFQTPRDAIIVMEFVRGGTLQNLMNAYQDGKMPEDHTRFIVMELAMALRHMHSSNMVHRDLKPINILIDSTGHVKLADMGLVSRIDETQKVIVKQRSEAVLQLDDEDDEDEEEEEEEESKEEKEEKQADIVITDASKLPKPKGRRYTRVGTIGYKAPELLLAKRPKRRTEEEKKQGVPPKESRGYCESVDWWSLGVLMLEMLTGKNHFSPKATQLLTAVDAEKLELSVIDAVNVPSSKLPSGISEEAKNFADGILHKDPNERLGTNPLGYRGICKHPWFKPIDQAKLLGREVTPPYKLTGVVRENSRVKSKWQTYDDMKREVDSVDINALMGETQDNTLADKHQKFFDSWDYVAPATFKLELGAQQQRHSIGAVEQAPQSTDQN